MPGSFPSKASGCRTGLKAHTALPTQLSRFRALSPLTAAVPRRIFTGFPSWEIQKPQPAAPKDFPGAGSLPQENRGRMRALIEHANVRILLTDFRVRGKSEFSYFLSLGLINAEHPRKPAVTTAPRPFYLLLRLKGASFQQNPGKHKRQKNKANRIG